MPRLVYNEQERDGEKYSCTLPGRCGPKKPMKNLQVPNPLDNEPGLEVHPQIKLSALTQSWACVDTLWCRAAPQPKSKQKMTQQHSPSTLTHCRNYLT